MNYFLKNIIRIFPIKFPIVQPNGHIYILVSRNHIRMCSHKLQIRFPYPLNPIPTQKPVAEHTLSRVDNPLRIYPPSK